MKIDSYGLKWIAVITMLIDHIGSILFPQVLFLRIIGRISFPIFCFLVVEGFSHTRNVESYIMRMGLFAILSEIPYDLAFRGTILEIGRQNVFFTLTLGLLLLSVVKISHNMLEKLLLLMFVMWLAAMLKTDYDYKGILLIFWFYIVREKKMIKLIGGAVWNVMSNNLIQCAGALAMLPIAAYSGERGRSMKYFFYLFYPLHLLALYVVAVWVI